METNSDLLKHIAFSDECIFLLGGVVNRQKYSISGSERPGTVYESPQATQSLMVRCGKSKTEVIGPHSFEDGTVTKNRYKRISAYYLFPKLAY